MNFHRCSICNKTNNEEVETDIGDYTTMTFVPDPDNPMFDICMECFEVVRVTLWELGENDELESKDS
jgi:hypothetical protein